MRRDRVAGLSATVIGAGALGNEVVRILGLLGWGAAEVVDPDIVEPSNLTRSVLFRTADTAGRNKADALAEAAGEIFPDTRWSSHPVAIAEVGFERLAGMDVLFSCVDSELARLEIASISTTLDIPCADGGTGGHDCTSGRASFFPGRESACFSCSLTPHTRRTLLSEWTASRRGCWSDPAGNSEPRPSTPTMAGIVASLMVELALRELDRGSRRAVTWEIDIRGTPRFEELAVPLSELCPFHEPEDAPRKPAGDASMTVREFLSRTVAGGRSTLVLDWPVCVAAACGKCGERWSPMRRLAGMARTCPRCGETDAVRKTLIDHVDVDSEWADCRLSDLGVPERHLCRVAPLPEMGS